MLFFENAKGKDREGYQKVFEGDAARAKEAIQAWIYDFLTTTRPPDVTHRKNIGVEVSQNNGKLSIKVKDWNLIRDYLFGKINDEAKLIAAQEKQP